jgi:phosphate-selective porin OprO/OprP
MGVEGRYGKVTDGQITFRSRPEAFPAPYFIDTGKIPVQHTRMVGGEAYYRPKNWLFGTEYWFVDASSPETGNPLFQGGDVMASWLVTGETRPYNTVGGYFGRITPAKSFLDGGPGAWEVVLRQSYIDMDSGTVQGGKFWRLTPMVNWYISEEFRLEAEYGYGVLDRFGLQGGTHFFQCRLQIWI